MARKFRTVDYEKSGQQTLTIDDYLPADHLARFIVAIVGMLDLNAFYAYYAAEGGEPIDPQVLLALLLYAYATGVFSSRKVELVGDCLCLRCTTPRPSMPTRPLAI